jgi:catechol 2,3-dioxygenase-like lactoylglutathione lyase family enzyme
MRLRHLNLRVADPAACRDFYCRHFGFRHEFDAEGGHFLRGDDGFLLAVVPTDPHVPLPDGFHVGFGAGSPEEVAEAHGALAAAGVRTAEVEDHRPGEDYDTFRCWDPDGTEVEVYWDGS